MMQAIVDGGLGTCEFLRQTIEELDSGVLTWVGLHEPGGLRQCGCPGGRAPLR
jgi:hypothetical protein